ncbi:hypothetical protein AAIR98_000835 [Elusimicrobium simillimum]
MKKFLNIVVLALFLFIMPFVFFAVLTFFFPELTAAGI